MALDVSWGPPGLTGSNVIECLGPPQWYGMSRAFPPHGESYITLGLYYPEKGIMIGGDTHSEIPIDPEKAYFDSFVYVRAGLIEDMLRIENLSSGSGLQTEAHREKLVSKLAPWPGRWEDIVLTE